MTELSERSGVARTTIGNWNTNRRKPYAKAVNAVADALGIDRAEAHVLAGIVAREQHGDDPEIPPGLARAVPEALILTVKRVLPREEWVAVLSAIAESLNPTEPAASSSDRSEAPRRAG